MQWWCGADGGSTAASFGSRGRRRVDGDGAGLQGLGPVVEEEGLVTAVLLDRLRRRGRGCGHELSRAWPWLRSGGSGESEGEGERRMAKAARGDGSGRGLSPRPPAPVGVANGDGAAWLCPRRERHGGKKDGGQVGVGWASAAQSPGKWASALFLLFLFLLFFLLVLF
jgi:hypothetical protein